MNAGMNSAMEDAISFSMETARLAGIYYKKNFILKFLFKENLNRQDLYKIITSATKK